MATARVIETEVVQHQVTVQYSKIARKRYISSCIITSSIPKVEETASEAVKALATKEVRAAEFTAKTALEETFLQTVYETEVTISRTDIGDILLRKFSGEIPCIGQCMEFVQQNLSFGVLRSFIEVTVLN